MCKTPHPNTEYRYFENVLKKWDKPRRVLRNNKLGNNQINVPCAYRKLGQYSVILSTDARSAPMRCLVQFCVMLLPRSFAHFDSSIFIEP